MSFSPPKMNLGAVCGLRSVRVGICEDPKDYRLCGYAEAVAGSKRARRGLNRVQQLPLDDWNSSKKNCTCGSQRYRMLLFDEGKERVSSDGKTTFQKGVKAEEVEKVLAQRGQLRRVEILRCRVRYFTQGRVLVGKAFVKGFQHVAVENRDRAVEMPGGLFAPRKIGTK